MLFSRAVIGLHHLVCRFIGGLLVFVCLFACLPVCLFVGLFVGLFAGLWGEAMCGSGQ